MKNLQMKCSVELVLAIFLCLAIVFLPGCGTSRGTTATKSAAVTSLSGLSESISEADNQVTETVAAALGLSGAADLQEAYEKFIDELDETRDMQEVASKRRANMRINADSYIQDWRMRNATVSSAELRAAGDQRAQEIAKRFEDVRDKADAAAAAYEPFITHLDDLEAYLNNDLTPAGVKAASPVIKLVTESGETLKAAIRAYAEELESVKRDLSPTPNPPPSE